MRYRDGRRSLCLSSQSGCPLTCTFCATGAMKFGRNLTASEILDQALHFRRIEPVDHCVFMGMGEPMMNLDDVLAAARAAARPRDHAPPHDDLDRRLDARASSGFVDEVDDADPPRALAARAPTTRCARELMPVNDRYPLADVLEACRALLRAPAPQGVRRVRDARRRQRPRRAGARSSRELLDRDDLQGQPDPVQPDRRATTARRARRSTRSSAALDGARRAGDRAAHARPRHRRRLRAARRLSRSCSRVDSAAVDQAWLDELGELLRIPSLSADPQRAGDVRAAAQWVADFVSRSGGEAELVDWNGRPLVIGEMRARAAERRRPSWSTATSTSSRPTRSTSGRAPPFEPTIRDGWLYARGVADDKGQLYLLLKAAAAARRRRRRCRSTCASRATARRRSAVTRSSTASRPDERGADAAIIFDARHGPPRRARRSSSRRAGSATSTSASAPARATCIRGCTAARR